MKSFVHAPNLTQARQVQKTLKIDSRAPDFDVHWRNRGKSIIASQGLA